MEQHNPMMQGQPQGGGPTPRLMIVEEVGHGEEETTLKSGQKRKNFVSVKNLPFHLVVSIVDHMNAEGQRILDFQSIAIDTELLYDTPDGVEKPVAHLKDKPVFFKRSNESNYPDSIRVECRLKVLTSQHEHSLFRVKVKGVHPFTGKDLYPPLAVISSPIRVISKSEQAKKKPEQKKPPFNNLLAEHIGRIEKRQAEQEQLIQHLLAQAKRARKGPSPFSPALSQKAGDRREGGEASGLFFANAGSSSSSSSPSSFTSISSPQSFIKPTDKPNTDPSSTTPSSTPTASQNASKLLTQKQKQKKGELHWHLINFFELFCSMPPEDRPSQIRKVVKHCSPDDLALFSEFLDCLGGALTRGVEGASGCTCSPCPYQLEVDKISAF